MRKKWLTASKVTAMWMLGLTTVVSAVTLYLMRMSHEIQIFPGY